MRKVRCSAVQPCAKNGDEKSATPTRKRRSKLLESIAPQTEPHGASLEPGVGNPGAQGPAARR